ARPVGPPPKRGGTGGRICKRLPARPRANIAPTRQHGATTMRLVLATFAVMSLAVAAAPGAQPAKAEVTYPWCAQYATQGSSNCGFATYQQCMAALSGNGGWCEQNPMFRPYVPGAL